jgi:hypothetical protein
MFRATQIGSTVYPLLSSTYGVAKRFAEQPVQSEMASEKNQTFELQLSKGASQSFRSGQPLRPTAIT